MKIYGSLSYLDTRNVLSHRSGLLCLASTIWPGSLRSKLIGPDRYTMRKPTWRVGYAIPILSPGNLELGYKWVNEIKISSLLSTEQLRLPSVLSPWWMWHKWKSWPKWNVAHGLMKRIMKQISRKRQTWKTKWPWRENEKIHVLLSASETLMHFLFVSKGKNPTELFNTFHCLLVLLMLVTVLLVTCSLFNKYSHMLLYS